MNIREGITFDDVLLVPKHSSIASRDEVDISSNLGGGRRIRVPIISANMDTVTDHKMIAAMVDLGANGILHRFMTVEEMEEELGNINHIPACIVRDELYDPFPEIASIGIGSKALERASRIKFHNFDGICVDVAHGDHDSVIRVLRELGDFKIRIAGNVATYDGAMRLIEAGANVIKVGIGPGSLCTTRVVTGCGVPQLTAISDVRRAIEDSGENVTLIGDGGIKSSGDIVKALAVGADTVMVGSLFAGTDESPGEVFIENGIRYKSYRGMASRAAQEDWKGYANYVEGESKRMPYKGSVREILLGLISGIKSGFSYLGARNVKELRENAEFVRVTHAGLIESRPHGLNT